MGRRRGADKVLDAVLGAPDDSRTMAAMVAERLRTAIILGQPAARDATSSGPHFRACRGQCHACSRRTPAARGGTTGGHHAASGRGRDRPVDR